jgi:hypothetical protein
MRKYYRLMWTRVDFAEGNALSFEYIRMPQKQIGNHEQRYLSSLSDKLQTLRVDFSSEVSENKSVSVPIFLGYFKDEL